MPLSGNDQSTAQAPEGIFCDIDPARADGSVLEQLALLLRRPAIQSSRALRNATGRSAANPQSIFRIRLGSTSGMRALMLRLNRRLGPLSGGRCFNALQIRGQGRVLHVLIPRGFGVDRRRVRWIFNSP
jgi:hypothetical protein